MIKSKHICLIIVGAAILYFIIKGIIESSQARCEVLEDFKEYKFNGLIVNKYIDSAEHSTKTVIISEFKKPFTYTLTTLDWDTTGFYYKINKNDTIIKDIGSDTVFVKNGSGKFRAILDFGCDKKK